VASFGAYFVLKPPDEAEWTGGILFDNAARRVLRVKGATALDHVRKASDYTALSAVLLAVGVDSLTIPLLRKREDVALQMLLMDAEAFSLSSFVTTMTYREVGRARPSYEDCQRDPNFDSLCNSGPYSSFPSGHSSSSATAAGLSCAHHLHLELYGNKVADALACGTTSALAVTTGLLRVMGDRHYVTDVLAAQVIGFGFGYGMPTLLHYAGAYSQSSARFVLTPFAGTQYGLRAIYVF
jgi:membrane-associated phospholipid phosphatase